MRKEVPENEKLNDIEKKLVKLLKEKGMKASSAESLTGGLVSKLITDVSGASEVFECGVCSYSNRIKHEVLGVSSETLKSFTEYSEECAKEMASGVRRLAGADIGISTTGLRKLWSFRLAAVPPRLTITSASKCRDITISGCIPAGT